LLKSIAGSGRPDVAEKDPEPEPEIEAPRPPVASISCADESFACAIKATIDKSNARWARKIADKVIRGDANNLEALEIAAIADQISGDNKSSAALWKTLMKVLTLSHRYDQALDALVRYYRLSHEDQLADDYFAAVARTPAVHASLRVKLDHLKKSDIACWKSLRGHVRQPLYDILFAESDVIQVSPCDGLPVTMPVNCRCATGKNIVAIINQADQDAFQHLRKFLPTLSAKSQAIVKAAVDAASCNDETYHNLLTMPRLNGAVIVDASNVAWHGQDMIACPKPRLNRLHAVQRELRRRGYFPIIVIADANFPYDIDDPCCAKQMIANKEISLVNSGIDADEQIVREARRLKVPVVTNDYMTDWDGDQIVEKIQYTIEQNGSVSLYR
jgi:hypothetical protein